MTDKIPVPPLGAAPATAEHFQIASQRPAVKFLSRGVQPPSQVYVTNQDVLTLFAASSLSVEAITATYRLLRADGELISGQFIFPITGDNNLNVHSEPLAEGFLLSLAVRARAATTRGQTFARLFLQNPSLGVVVPSYMLMADYVTTAMSAAYPNGRVLMPTEGPGFPRAFLEPAPGPGENWLIEVPANTRWRLVSVFAGLTTNAVAGNRLVTLGITRNGNQNFMGVADHFLGPGILGFYSFHQLSTTVIPTTNRFCVPLPPEAILLAGDNFFTFVDALDPGDQWGTINCGVEEWLDNV